MNCVEIVFTLCNHIGTTEPMHNHCGSGGSAALEPAVRLPETFEKVANQDSTNRHRKGISPS